MSVDDVKERLRKEWGLKEVSRFEVTLDQHAVLANESGARDAVFEALYSLAFDGSWLKLEVRHCHHLQAFIVTAIPNKN